MEEETRESLIAFELPIEPGVSELRRVIEAAGGPVNVFGKPIEWKDLQDELVRAVAGERALSFVSAHGAGAYPIFTLWLRPPTSWWQWRENEEDVEVREPLFEETPLRLATLTTGGWNKNYDRDLVQRLFLRAAESVRGIFNAPFAFGGPRALFSLPGDARLRAWPITYYRKDRLPPDEALRGAAYVEATSDGGAWVLAHLEPFDDSAEVRAARDALAKSLGLD